MHISRAARDASARQSQSLLHTEPTDQQRSEHGVSGDTDQCFNTTRDLTLQQNTVEARVNLVHAGHDGCIMA